MKEKYLFERKQCIQKYVIHLLTTFGQKMEGNAHNKINSIYLFFITELKSFHFSFPKRIISLPSLN